jgi:hypothetical protein
MPHRSVAAFLALVLSACATPSMAPAPVSGATGQGPVLRGRMPPPRTAAIALRPGVTTTAEARALLGAPDVERRDGVGALLVWTLPGCALSLGFANDRLRTVEPGPRRTGAAAPSLDACLAEARSRAS